MKNLKYLILFGALGVFVFAGCKDEDTESVFDYHVHIHSPNSDDKHVDDTLHIEVEFVSHKGQPVHHVNVRIYNKADNTEVYNKPDEAHVHETDGTFLFEDDFVLSNANGVMADTDWVLEAKVWGHEDGVEEVMGTVEFYVLP